MAGSRHFFGRGTSSDDQLKSEIQSDVAAARGAQRDLTAAGQYGAAARMGEAADEALDELNDLSRGAWKPKHA